jgi:hypothetical protein
MLKYYPLIVIVLFCHDIVISQSNESAETTFVTDKQTDATFNELQDECTIGVAAGSATTDGRPLVWKTRDNSSAPNNKIKYVTNFTYKYVCVGTATSSPTPWMGVNEKGLAIVNSVSSDLPGGVGPGNGPTMAYALAYCKNMEEFEAHLDSTNITGRSTKTNFAVIDATGAAAIFETGGNVYYKFDASEAPAGYIVRSNFSINGGGDNGIERYIRSSNLMESFYSGDSLNYKSILRYQMRDFSDWDSEPIVIPYPHVWSTSIPMGYFPTNVSICRNTSVSTAVIQGILPDEPPELSTMWAMLGNPAAAITVPYWPVIDPPSLVTGGVTAPLCDISNDIREFLFDLSSYPTFINTYMLLDGGGDGLWTHTFPVEDQILEDAEGLLNDWRILDSIPFNEMMDTENTLAEMAYNALENYLNQTAVNPSLANASGVQIYPNPVSDYVNIDFDFGKGRSVTGQLYDASGRWIRELFPYQKMDDPVVKSFDFSDLKPGAYFIVIACDHAIQTKNVIKY